MRTKCQKALDEDTYYIEFGNEKFTAYYKVLPKYFRPRY